MKPLRLILHTQPSQRLDMRLLQPEQLRDLSLAEIARLPLGHHAIVLADCFTICDGSREQIVLYNSGAQLDYLGCGMKTGRLHIIGTAGAYLGHALAGGHIHVLGDVGDYAATHMRAGEIFIQGNVGHYLAAHANMYQNGRVIVTGEAGTRVAFGMRRGFVLIEGNVDAYAAAQLFAGTVCCFGEIAHGFGYGMRRGSLVLKHAPENIAFRYSGIYTGIFLNLLQQTCDYPSAPARKFIDAHRWVGDCTTLCKGEILVVNCVENLRVCHQIGINR